MNDNERKKLEAVRATLDNVRGNINPERGFADELESDVEAAIATVDELTGGAAVNTLHECRRNCRPGYYQGETGCRQCLDVSERLRKAFNGWAPPGESSGAFKLPDLADTTRTYPRTAREAFKGVDYGAAIERPARRYPGGWWALLTLCGLAGLVLSWVTR